MAPPKTPGHPRGTVHGASFQNLVTFTIRAVPIPDIIVEFLRSNLTVIKRLIVIRLEPMVRLQRKSQMKPKRPPPRVTFYVCRQFIQDSSGMHCRLYVKRQVLNGRELSTTSGLWVPMAQENVF